MKVPVRYLRSLKKHFKPFVATGMAVLTVGDKLTAQELKAHLEKSHPRRHADSIKPPDTAGVVPVTIKIDFRISKDYPFWNLTHVHAYALHPAHCNPISPVILADILLWLAFSCDHPNHRTGVPSSPHSETMWQP